MNFQNAHLKTGCEPIAIAVPKCFYSKYKSGFSDAPDDNTSPEPPESILVLQDMRPLGFKASDIWFVVFFFLCSFNAMRNTQKRESTITFVYRMPDNQFKYESHIISFRLVSFSFQIDRQFIEWFNFRRG